jgi:hypothetical protein
MAKRFIFIPLTFERVLEAVNEIVQVRKVQPETALRVGEIQVPQFGLNISQGQFEYLERHLSASRGCNEI